MTANNPDRLMTISEACDYLRVQRTTFWQLRKTHHIPEIRLCGRSPRFLLSDLNSLVKGVKFHPNDL